MIAIGIDSVLIARFSPLAQLPAQRLARVYSHEEIAYSLATPALAAQRLAVRFAAKEALYKALSQISPTPYPLLRVMRACSIHHTSAGAPIISINWQLLQLTPQPTNVSLTHTDETATACVVLQATT